MNFVDLSHKDVLAAEAELPVGKPVVMLNLLAFNAEAKYEGRIEKPCSGMDAYMQRYAPAFTQVTKELGVEGVEVLYVGGGVQMLLGPKDPKWQTVALVRYPDFASLRKIIESDAYLQKAEPHRKAALRAWEFMATVPPAETKGV